MAQSFLASGGLLAFPDWQLKHSFSLCLHRHMVPSFQVSSSSYKKTSHIGLRVCPTTGWQQMISTIALFPNKIILSEILGVRNSMYHKRRTQFNLSISNGVL
jgi:hypothetical protein